jgi:SAM-dependent methyltransferase
MFYYDDAAFSYPAFWANREYEHESEILAIERLLGERRVDTAVDIGGGFGRLVACLSRFARKVIVVEPSEVQRKLIGSFAPDAIVKSGNAADTGLPVKSCDLVVMVRVAHHLPNLEDTIAEIYKILKPGGLLVLEFANANHFKSRLRHYARLRAVPRESVKVNAQEIEIPFVNHHPAAVKKLLQVEGFTVLKQLSVSNYRSSFLKKLLPISTLLAWERVTQRPLAYMHFGPSVFILAKR